MKIGITSDTHHSLRLTTLSQIEAMAEKMFAAELDIIVHAGDIAEVRANMEFFQNAIRVFTKGKAKVLAMLGNHDIWKAEWDDFSSLELWEKILPEILAKENVHYLELENFVTKGVAIIGSYLHYNYSAQDPEGAAVAHIRREIKRSYPDWSMNQYYERFKKNINNDGNFLKGLPSDREFSEQIGNSFRKRLAAAESNNDIHSIILITHVPCMPSLITRKPHDLMWSLGTPYFGNLSHVDVILKSQKIKAIVSGHSHVGIKSTELFEDGREVPTYCINSDYGKPGFVVVEV